MRLGEAFQVLGLGPDASPDEVRARYRERVKACPPERDPEGFARLREAMERATDLQARAVERVMGPPAYRNLAECRDDLRGRPRRPLGPTAWLELLGGR